MKTKKCSKQQKSIRKKCNPKNEKEAGIHGLYGAKGSDFVDNGKDDPHKNKGLYNFLSRMKVFRKNLQENVLFWTTYSIAIIILSIKYGEQSSILKNIFMGFVSALLGMSTGYMAHYLSHKISFKKLYNDSVDPDYFSENTHTKIKRIIDYTLDFHDIIHHNSSINKYWYNILMEAIQNILLEGGLWAIASVILGLEIKIFDETYKLNVVTMLLWMLLYASVHLINYRLVHPNSHIAHHMDYYKNLSLTDMFDLIFDTKYDKKNIQDLNHFIINVVIITTLLYFGEDICQIFTNF